MASNDKTAPAALGTDFKLPDPSVVSRSMADIAETLGCTAKAVENRLYRAGQQLKLRLGTAAD